MEYLTRLIDEAISDRNYKLLSDVFSGGSVGSSSWQSVGPGEQRSVAAHFICSAVAAEGFLSNALEQQQGGERMIETMTTALGHLPASVEGASDSKLRQVLFGHLVSMEEYVRAGRILSAMRMDDEPGSLYYTSLADKADVYVKIAECFLACDEVAEADGAVGKAGSVIEQMADRERHTALVLRYKSTCARVLDANRKFLQAATRYHELSQTVHSEQVDRDDLLQLLGRAVACIILAPSGPQRQRVLQSIAADKRLGQLSQLKDFAAHANVLRKMDTYQILRPADLLDLERSLAEHQRAVMGDGLTILERGVVEHNMIAVSRLYESVYLSDLAVMLNVDRKKAEKIAASMIVEGAIHGYIDHVEGFLEFQQTETPEERWDQAVADFCSELNLIVDAIKSVAVPASPSIRAVP